MNKKMDRIFFGILFGIFLVSFASAGISFENEPLKVYNLGDRINASLIIIPEPSFNEVVSVILVCGSS
ncbi:MAG: hypothetical protein KKB62_02940, partial [Nanoarchaeota archaeon]|nr:hypothetical protein [Nanoarchaeota archaeon]